MSRKRREDRCVLFSRTLLEWPGRVLRRAIYIPPWICGIPRSGYPAIKAKVRASNGGGGKKEGYERVCGRRSGAEGGREEPLYPLRSAVAFPRSCRTRRPVIVITGETFREKARPIRFVLFLFSFFLSPFRAMTAKIPPVIAKIRAAPPTVEIGVIKLAVVALSSAHFFFLFLPFFLSFFHFFPRIPIKFKFLEFVAICCTTSRKARKGGERTKVTSKFEKGGRGVAVSA